VARAEARLLKAKKEMRRLERKVSGSGRKPSATIQADFDELYEPTEADDEELLDPLGPTRNIRPRRELRPLNRFQGQGRLAAQPAPQRPPPQRKTYEKVVVGSVQCTCPPNEEFGRCYNVTNFDHSTLEEYQKRGAHECPAVGVSQECGGTGSCSQPLPEVSSFYEPMHVSVLQCNVTAKCSASVRTEQCMCRAAAFRKCTWSTTPCDMSPFYAPFPAKLCKGDGAHRGGKKGAVPCYPRN